MVQCLRLGGTPTDEHGLPWHILSVENKTLATREQQTIHGIMLIEGIVLLDGSSQLIIEN